MADILRATPYPVRQPCGGRGRCGGCRVRVTEGTTGDLTATGGRNCVEIFREDCKYLLCVRTPCSGDFAAEAERAGAFVGLPIQRTDATLDNLETVLQRAIVQRAW